MVKKLEDPLRHTRSPQQHCDVLETRLFLALSDNSKTSSMTLIFCCRGVISTIKYSFFQKNYRSGYRATPNSNFFSNFVKYWILTFLFLLNNKKMEVTELVFNYCCLKLKFGLFLTGSSVAMVTYRVGKIQNLLTNDNAFVRCHCKGHNV